MNDDLSGFDAAPLSPRETQKVRRIIRDKEFWERLFYKARIWLGYGGVVVTAIFASWDYVAKVFRALAK